MTRTLSDPTLLLYAFLQLHRSGKGIHEVVRLVPSFKFHFSAHYKSCVRSATEEGSLMDVHFSEHFDWYENILKLSSTNLSLCSK